MANLHIRFYGELNAYLPLTKQGKRAAVVLEAAKTKRPALGLYYEEQRPTLSEEPDEISRIANE